jgi:hypothetical protein
MTNPEKPCSMSGCLGKIDFCFWAKLLVAIPALPLIALIAASFFEDGQVQSIAGILAVIGAVLLARKIDRIPALQKKVMKPKD